MTARVRILFIFVVAIALALLDLAVGVGYSILTDDMTEKYFIWDEEIGLLHKPDVAIEMPWPEYDRGQVRFRTNNLGFREDRATDTVTHRLVRVMVFGDSHTDGVVDNDESFVNLLEVALNRSDTGRVEIINAGVGLFTLESQWKLCQRLLWLNPDVLVFSIFTGNDYMEILHPPLKPSVFDHWQRSGIVPRLVRRLDFTSRARAERVNRYALWQSLGQADFFKRYPGRFAGASQRHEELVAEIQERARERHIGVLFLIMPSKYSVERESIPDFRVIEGILDLSPDDRLEDRIAEDLRSIFRRRLAPFVDVQSEVRKSVPRKQLFWNSDHHLGVEGHRLVADIVTPELATAIDAADNRTSRGNLP